MAAMIAALISSSRGEGGTTKLILPFSTSGNPQFTYKDHSDAVAVLEFRIIEILTNFDFAMKTSLGGG